MMPQFVHKHEDSVGFDPDFDSHVSSSVARQEFSDVVDRAGRGERIVVTEHGRPSAVFASVRDYRILKILEDSDFTEKIEAMMK